MIYKACPLDLKAPISSIPCCISIEAGAAGVYPSALIKVPDRNTGKVQGYIRSSRKAITRKILMKLTWDMETAIQSQKCQLIFIKKPTTNILPLLLNYLLH